MPLDYLHLNVSDCCQAIRRSKMARKETELTLYSTHGVRGNHAILKEAVASADNLGIHRQYYRRFHPAIRHQARSLCILKFEAPFATTCR